MGVGGREGPKYHPNLEVGGVPVNRTNMASTFFTSFFESRHLCFFYSSSSSSETKASTAGAALRHVERRVLDRRGNCTDSTVCEERS